MNSTALLRRSLRVLINLLICAGFFLPMTLIAADGVSVAQGEIGRWADGGFDSCGMDGRVWPALEGSCYYPVDVDRTPGKIEIAAWNGGTMNTAWLTIEAKDYGTQEIDFPDESYVHLSDDSLHRHYGEQAEIKPKFRRGWGTAPQFTLPLAEPLDPLPTCKNFGVFRVFNGEAKNRHTGIDCAVGQGTSTKSVAAGKVVLTGEHFFAGTRRLYDGLEPIGRIFMARTQVGNDIADCQR